MHEEHRQRLKNRFLREGLDNFEEHNVLELLLFFSIPRKDVNETAHELINRFGSLAKVFDADFDELMSVPGIKEHSATLIKLMPAISRYYSVHKNNVEGVPFTLETIGNYMIDKYVGVTVETVYLLMLDNKLSLIDCVKICEGSVNSAHFELRPLAEQAYAKKASCVVLAHNHPGGTPLPSSDDIQTTRNLETIFDALGVKMLDHIIVGSGKFLPVLGKDKSVVRTGIPKGFYD